MRGKLISPFLVEIEHLDPSATQTANGYDPIFKEPLKRSTGSGGGVDETVRVRTKLKCQIGVNALDKLQEFFSGNTPDAKLTLTLHFKDLEEHGLVDASGHSFLYVGDRIIGFYEITGRPIQTQPDPAYITELQPGGFGLGHSRNLLLVTFSCRETAANP